MDNLPKLSVYGGKGRVRISIYLYIMYQVFYVNLCKYRDTMTTETTEGHFQIFDALSENYVNTTR